MKQRLNYSELGSQFVQKLGELGLVIKKSLNDETLYNLAQIRASQLNGCTFCVDMHSKQAKIHGERELRLYHIPVWRESNLFSEKERAVLEWTELVTKLTEKGISDNDYENIRKHLSEKEITDLTFVIGIINVWNRLSVSFKSQHGDLDKAFGLEKANLN